MRSFVGPRGLGLVVGVGLVLALATGCGDDDGGPTNDGGSAGTGATGGGPSTDVTWCEVSQVLEAKCQRCHADPPVNGAPFPLISYDDTQVEVSGIVRYDRMQDMVDRRLMPPAEPELDPPAEPLTNAERALLLDWFDQGAKPAGGTECE